jgi:hypothetical protein
MTTPRLQLPELAQNQAQPHLTVNGALRLLDVFAQGAVTAVQNTPPGSPSDGDVYIVGTSPTGAWSGQANRIAAYVGTTWIFIPPRDGFYFYNDSASSFWRYNAGWYEDVSGGGLTDAPSDSQTYGRRNGAWEVIAGGGGGGGYDPRTEWWFFEDFESLAKWDSDLASGGTATVADDTTYTTFGILRLLTDAASGSRAGVGISPDISSASPAMLRFGTIDNTTVRFLIRHPEGAFAGGYVARFGIADRLQAGAPSASFLVTAQTNGTYFSWHVVPFGGTPVDLEQAITDNPVEVRLVVSGTDILVYIGGTLEYTYDNSVNEFEVAGTLVAQIENADTSSHEVLVDFVEARITGLSRY